MTPPAKENAAPPDTRAIVFDLGNVLIDIDFMRCARDWSRRAGIPTDQIVARFRIDRHYKAFERGQLSPEAYFDVLRRQLVVDLEDAGFTVGWNRIIQDERPGIRACIRRLKLQFPLYILTNTNAIHAAQWRSRHARLLAHFRQVFVSSEMGCRKPDAAVYHAVITAVGVPAETIVFMDDAPENVREASAAGLRAFRVNTPDDVFRLTAGLIGANTP